MRASVLAATFSTLLAACACAPARQATQPPLALAVIDRPAGETPDWWFRAGAIAAHDRGAGQAHARNLVLFVGDGMSLATVAAARILLGQRHGQPGEETQLSFESFPHTALSRTYDTDSQTPDSAGTMTAMVTGAKTRIGMLSVGQSARRGGCASAAGTELATLLELAESAGLSTGVVTTTRLTHATPAATYAHSPERNWESDGDLDAAAREHGCRDIADQFIAPRSGDGVEVAMGGGRSQFLPAGADDPTDPTAPGLRLDGRDLTHEWLTRNPGGRYVTGASQLASLAGKPPARLLGLFAADHMAYEHERTGEHLDQPSLAQMTRAAIGVLRGNPDGFFLMVEGGRIDHAHHAGNAFRALDETIAFAEAVKVAETLLSSDDTLILVTADHSHTLTFMGYPQRGNPILGKVMGRSAEDAPGGLASDALGLPYTTLSYANGPGYAGATDQQARGAKRFPHIVSGAQAADSRPSLRDVDTQDPDYLQEATLPLGSETHGGEDVGVWARGPGADAVRGSIEQNVIFHLMLQAQPRLVALLCRLGDCEHGVPVRRPTLQSLTTVPPRR